MSMFRTLLTPLKATFDAALSPRPPLNPNPDLQEEEDDDGLGAPEDFARDVLVELMRNGVENLKVLGTGGSEVLNVGERNQVLGEIHSILVKDKSKVTKDVFREMDGFLVLISLLSTINVGVERGEEAAAKEEKDGTGIMKRPEQQAVVNESEEGVVVSEPEEEGTSDESKQQGLHGLDEQVLVDEPKGDHDPEAHILEGTKLIFQVLSEAMDGCEENKLYFEKEITYPTLSQALFPLSTPSQPLLASHIPGLLLSFSLNDFSLASLFSQGDGDIGFAKYEPSLKTSTIKHSGALKALWELVHVPPPSSTPGETQNQKCRYMLYKTLYTLTFASHRNRAILSSEDMGFVGSLFERFEVLKRSSGTGFGTPGGGSRVGSPGVPGRVATPGVPGRVGTPSRGSYQGASPGKVPSRVGTPSRGMSLNVGSGGVIRPIPKRSVSLVVGGKGEEGGETEGELWEKERVVVTKLLKRLLEMGADTSSSRLLFKHLVKSPLPQPGAEEEDGILVDHHESDSEWVDDENVLHGEGGVGKERLDADVLELVRSGMRSRWVPHLSIERSGSVRVGLAEGAGGKGKSGGGALPGSGVSVLMWIYISHLPQTTPQTIFTFLSPPPTRKPMLKLSIGGDGKLMLLSSSFKEGKETVVLGRSGVGRGRWCHLGVVCFPGAAKGGGGIRIFVDGVLSDTLNWGYPKAFPSLPSSSGVSFLSPQHHASSFLSPHASSFLSPHTSSFLSPHSPTRQRSASHSHSLSPSYARTPSHPRSSSYSHARSPSFGGEKRREDGVAFVVGDEKDETAEGEGRRGEEGARDGDGMSWCVGSAVVLGVPLADDLPRLIHHLGPRYTSHFQSKDMVKFLTYEASTSLNIFLHSISSSPVSPNPSSTHNRHASSKRGPGQQESGLARVLKEGMGIPESAILVSINHASFGLPGDLDLCVPSRVLEEVEGDDGGPRLVGDVLVVKAQTLDLAMWKIGGAAVGLRVVQLAENPHELSRALGVLTDGLRNCWQNSEDMERLRGYDILAYILRGKSELINMTGFETLFEFMGMNYKSLENSTITNTIAYRSIALDFELWSKARRDIQQVHLEHFVILLQRSRFKKFNAKVRFGNGKLGVVGKLLFVLQTDWYDGDWERDGYGFGSYLGGEEGGGRGVSGGLIKGIVDALKVVAQANFSTDEVIKPTVSYLAANLHDGSTTISSPRSVISRIDRSHSREKSEQVLEAFISILSSSQMAFNKFVSTLPLTRITLLLLGDKPTPITATQVLRLIGLSVTASSSFNRKFELVSGWSVLKTVLPFAWDSRVRGAAFEVMLGSGWKGKGKEGPAVVCQYVVPAILASLNKGLEDLGVSCATSMNGEASSQMSGEEPEVELLIEELIDLHSSSPTFRKIFESQQATQQFVDAYKSFQKAIATLPEIDQPTTRVLEKLSHLGLTLALDNAVSGHQKREILDTLQLAQSLLNPGSSQRNDIDPALIPGRGSRPMSMRMVSARLSVLQVGEKAVAKSMSRIHDWRKTVIESERKRLRKRLLDLRENHRQISRLDTWAASLMSERGLWERKVSRRLWRLDETEGPYRVRKKLEPENSKDSESAIRVDRCTQMRIIQAPDSDAQSMVQVEVPPWAEAYEVSSTDLGQLAEEVAEDKHRRVRHELEPGDVIEAVSTVARIAGVDSSPGLLICGRSHIYMLDGLVENDDGEVIDVHDAPRRLFFVPGSIVELDGPQRAQRWSYEQIAGFSDKTFLFRDVGLELYFRDSRSLLVVFVDKKNRHSTTSRLSSLISTGASSDQLTPVLMRTPILGKVGNKVFSGFRPDELSTAQRKWQAREISNFTYLSILNQLSGRTPADATQYPIFPWVLRDYLSSTLDLTSPDVFRDLTCPMGALTPARREAAEQRYLNLEGVGEQPFHYGTHFSSSMIVCHFLIRLSPFTHMFKTLQGGDWDLPDRLFSDICRAYDSASSDIRGDVRELIPEFFTCPEFLENTANLDFGIQQHTGERIHNVKLPPWARQDPLLFVTLNRKALESDFVSENLPSWIDLIWGCKQRDPTSLNVFHPLSYEGSIDLDSIKDDLEREATVGIIHNFGQTPRKLFGHSHPPRYMHGLSSLPLGTLHGIEEDFHLLAQSTRVVKDLGFEHPVREIALDLLAERVIPYSDGALCVPSHPHERIEWTSSSCGTGGGELRVIVDRKVVQVIEGANCTCATFADANHLVTGSSDQMVRLWRISRTVPGSGQSGKEMTLSLTLSHVMRAHSADVVAVTTSRPWSLVVSGSRDGTAILWDLNKGIYVQSIWHGNGETVHLVAVNDSTGYIATCSRTTLSLHTINARHITSLDLTSAFTPSPSLLPITCLAFHEREYSHLGVLATGGPDGTITLRTWNADGTPEGQRAQWEFVTMRFLKLREYEDEDRSPRAPSVTALKFVGECLYHGEDTGRVYSWDLPE
ncbi:hypothetical protein JAAARDRAFT_61057 [Jaapia argillacea MUCL 33604]|uniref:Beach-domain-containing protein n=1 Tax=Jaapia argillacea MUCL 33604 TaxID=933084 RepID=A0A067PUG4_9AGAM|nr:hypothetical protein JAAARDRAFT_61057 [Jaapia argillacea MUCL 33604]